MLCFPLPPRKGCCSIPSSTPNTASGFTLLEILIVVVIMGILSAIAIPGYVTTVDKFKYGHAKVQMDCLKKEIIGYQLENGDFPEEVADDIPSWSKCFQSEDIPFESKYDYNQWRVGKSCYVGVTFLGKDQEKESLDQSNIPVKKGFVEDGDDLILSMGMFDYGCSNVVTAPSPPSGPLFGP